MEPEIEVELPPDVYLEVTKKDGEVFRFPITKKTVTIGRDPGCDLRLTDQYVSRKHCQVVFRGDHFTVIDLGSLNKTVVKGKQYIQKNLRTGNLLHLGETQLRFVWDNYLQWRHEHGITEEPSEEGDQPDLPGQSPADTGTE
jgi:pSer/pThr/pTyr-binding forkhead associated (FHA) protein